MKNSGFRRKNPHVEASANKPNPKFKSNEAQYNCKECFFQATSRTELNNHFKLKHTKEENTMQSTIKCKNCGEQFSSKWNLMYHRKSKHLNTVAFCRNNLGGKCPY